MHYFEEFGLLLSETAHTWRNRLDARLKPLGLSQSGWLVLIHLDRHGDGLSQRELAEHIGVEGPSLVGVLDRLEAGGHIERRVMAHDRRAKGVYRTAQGMATTIEIRQIATQLRRELLNGFDPSRLAECMTLLQQLKQRANDL